MKKKHFLWTNIGMLIDSRVDLRFLTSLEFDNYVLDRQNDLIQILENAAGELEAIIVAIDKIIELSEPKNNDKIL